MARGETGGSQREPLLQSRLDQIHEEEKRLAEMRHSKGPFDRAVRTLTTNIREKYEGIILENLATSEPVEQQLWRLHYTFIEEFRGRLGRLKAAAAANVPIKKKSGEEQKFHRVGGQYKCFLDEATGFYHGLIAKLRAKHGLPADLSSSDNAAGNSGSTEEIQRCQCVCYRCFIYLGDLARYKELHLVVEGRTADWSVAASYYRQASTLWPDGGNPHNQLGVLATYAGDNLQAVYHYLYSLAVPIPFLTARANMKLLFEKNQQQIAQLSGSPEEDRAIDIKMAQSFDSDSFRFSSESHRGTADEKLTGGALVKLQRRFRVHFISLIGILFTKAGLEEVDDALSLMLREAHLLLSQDNALVTMTSTLEMSNHSKGQGFSVLQLVVSLILSIYHVGHKKKRFSASTDSQRWPLVGQATKAAFQFVSQLMHHAARAEQPPNSPLFPAVVVFCKWLASYPDLIVRVLDDEECDRLQCTFWKEACVLLSRCLKRDGVGDVLGDDSPSSPEKKSEKTADAVLWEDKELHGLVPLRYLESKEISVLSKGPHALSEPDSLLRVQRLVRALKSLSCQFKVDSPDFDLIAAISRSSSGYARVGPHPFEWQRCSQLSGGSERSADGSLEVKTQGPQIVDKISGTNLVSHGKEDSLFVKKVMSNSPMAWHPPNEDAVRAARLLNPRNTPLAGVVEREAALDQRLGFVGPSQVNPGLSLAKTTGGMSEAFHQQGSIIMGTSQHKRSSLQQPEEMPSDNNLETILEDRICNAHEQTEDAAGCPLGRGALSLGDWVKPQDGSGDQVNASSAFKKRGSSHSCRVSAAEQGQAEESLVPSLSFNPVLGGKSTTPSCPAFSNEAPLRGGDCQSEGLELICIETEAQRDSVFWRQSRHLAELSEQNDVVLDCEGAQTVNTGSRDKAVVARDRPGKAELGSEESRSRKWKQMSHKAVEGLPSRDGTGRAQNVGEEGTGLGHQVVEGGVERVEFEMEHVTSSSKKRKFVSQGPPERPGEIGPDCRATFEHAIHRTEDIRRPGCDEDGVRSDNQVVVAQSAQNGPPLKVLVEMQVIALEGKGATASQSKKRKLAKLTPHVDLGLPSPPGPDCRAPNPTKDEGVRGACLAENGGAGASQSRQWRHAPHRAFTEPRPGVPDCGGSYLDGREGWLPPLQGRKWQDAREDGANDYGWLDTYTHVVPQALAKLADIMSRSSPLFPFSEFGIFREFGASLGAAQQPAAAGGHD